MQAKPKHRRNKMQCALINHIEVGTPSLYLNNDIDYFVRAVSQGILMKVFVENLYKGFVEVKYIGERNRCQKEGVPASDDRR